MLIYLFLFYRVATIYPPANTLPATTAEAMPAVAKNTIPATAKTEVAIDSTIDDVFIV